MTRGVATDGDSPNFPLRNSCVAEGACYKRRAFLRRHLNRLESVSVDPVIFGLVLTAIGVLVAIGAWWFPRHASHLSRPRELKAALAGC